MIKLLNGTVCHDRSRWLVKLQKTTVGIRGYSSDSKPISQGSSSPNKRAERAVNEEKSDEEKRAEAAELAMQSIKDLGSIFSLSGGKDDDTQPIDTKPIYKDPKLFGSLSLLHQGQVLKQLQKRLDKNWTRLTREEKKLGYFISYGDWGVREEFSNWNTNEPPYDLPFRVPSKLKTLNPTPNTVIKLLKPPVNLAETKVRAKQFDVKKMDGITKFFIYLTVLISMFALHRDKNIGEAGKPVELVIEDRYEIERQKRVERQAQTELELELQQSSSNKRWYYFWLK